MNVDLLNALVSGAIWRAEQLEEHHLGSAPLAWREVSTLEEQLAAALPVSQPEGRVARRGAVRAALKARDYERAHALTHRFLADQETPESLRSALRGMLEEDARTLAERYRFAARHHGVNDARELARRLQAGGAFGLAA